MMDKKELFELLKSSGCNPEYYNRDVLGFSRNIKFVVNHVPCYVEWWSNNSWLSIEQRYLIYIPFTMVTNNTTWPSYKKGLKFTYSREPDKEFEVCWLAIDKLDWQEKKTPPRE